MLGGDGASTDDTTAGVCACIADGEIVVFPSCRGEEESVMGRVDASNAKDSDDAVPDHPGTAVGRVSSHLIMLLSSCFRSCVCFLMRDGGGGASSCGGGGDGSSGSGDIRSDSSVVVRFACDRRLRRFWNQMVTWRGCRPVA